MGILDGVVEWISEQIMHGLDLINTSVLGALGCGMDTFLRYFPAAETMYDIFTAIGIGLILLMWVWNLFKNYWLGAGFEAEHPVKLTFRAIIFITLTYCAKSIVEIVLKIGGTPYDWILSSELPPLSFADFNSVMLVIIGACANGAVTLIVLTAILTAFGVFDKIAKHAGAGTIVPITGFANSIVSPALEFSSEGHVLGTGAEMFRIAGPVLVYGSAAAVIYGFIYWIFR